MRQELIRRVLHLRLIDCNGSVSLADVLHLCVQPLDQVATCPAGPPVAARVRPARARAGQTQARTIWPKQKLLAQ
jgi:hypothetical protein